MKRVTGIGGVFFKAKDPKTLGQWYADHLGIEQEADSPTAVFRWQPLGQPDQVGVTVWAVFPQDADYLGAETAPLMIDYSVDDLDALLVVLKEEGVQIDQRGIQESEHGRFAWITDPEGNRVELWEAPERY